MKVASNGGKWVAGSNVGRQVVYNVEGEWAGAAIGWRGERRESEVEEKGQGWQWP